MRKVFVASSSRALHHAETISGFLNTLDGFAVSPWKEFFSTGRVNLQSLNKAYGEVAGALILLTPDHKVKAGDGFVNIPRSNVALELGLFGARLGWANVAICLFDGVELPTDLDGMFYVKLGVYPNRAKLVIPEDACLALKRWASGLQEIPGTLPRTKLFHGYSGVWSVEMRFPKWLNHKLKNGEVADIHNGELHLSIPQSGREGKGWCTGEVSVAIKNRSSGRYTATYNTVDMIYNAECGTDGTLLIKSMSAARYRLSHSGTPWFDPDIASEMPRSRRYRWELKPGRKDGTFCGLYLCENDDRSVGEVTLQRTSFGDQD